MVVLICSGVSCPVFAAERPLEVSTETIVAENGIVRILLSLKNLSREPLYNVHPMFHFHHTMAMMPKIMRLEPGQGITMENTDHPPVARDGRYPLVAMVRYQKDKQSGKYLSQIHTDSFYYNDPVESAIEGKIDSVAEEGVSLLKVWLLNTSSSFKNVRLRLLLPPGLITEKFQGMMGFTLLAGEEKRFEVPVRKLSDNELDTYPVYLMIEYAEMLKHYTGEVRGNATFQEYWTVKNLALHLALILAFGTFLCYRYWKRKKCSLDGYSAI